MYAELENTAIVHTVDVALGEQVSANQQVASARIILAGGNQQIIPMRAPVDGYVYQLNVVLGQSVESRLFSWMNIVEEEERFTNVMEYKANDRDQDGILDGRSTNPLNADTDSDGLIDGIEVMGWEILVVNRGVQPTWVTSDPGLTTPTLTVCPTLTNSLQLTRWFQRLQSRHGFGRIDRFGGSG